jgi:hypothetical protein
MKEVQRRQLRTVFAITAELKSRGFDGAIVDNTLKRGGPPEIVVFDWKKIRLP